MAKRYYIKKKIKGVDYLLKDSRFTTIRSRFVSDIGYAKEFFTQKLAIAIAMKYDAKLIEKEEAWIIHEKHKADGLP